MFEYARCGPTHSMHGLGISREPAFSRPAQGRSIQLSNRVDKKIQLACTGRRVAALVLAVDPARRPRIDAAQVAATLEPYREPLPRPCPYHRTEPLSIAPCSAGSAALSLRLPSRPRLTSGARFQRAPARHVRASSPASPSAA